MMVFSRYRQPLSSIAGGPCRTIAVLAMAAALLAANGSSQGQAAGNETVVAKVDGVVIDSRDYDLAQQAFAPDLRGLDEKARHDFLMQYLIDLALMAKEARRQNLAIDETALQRNFDFLRNKALMEKLLGNIGQSAATDEAVRQAYDLAVKDVTAEPEVRLQTMHFKVDDISDEKAVKAAEARANEAVERVRKGEDFVKVAEDMTGTSTSASLSQAGYMSRQQMGREIAQAAFAVEVGGVSVPIKTEPGFEVIKVLDRRTRKPPEFDVVRNNFVTFVARKAQLETMEKLRSAAKIERISSEPQSVGQVVPAPK